MKKRKILSLITVLALIVGVFSMIPSVGAVSDRPVKLIYAKPSYDQTKISALGYVEIENIAYDKNVTIHYSFDGTKWYDCSAEYYKHTWGNYEAWKFETSGLSPSYRGSITIQFAIKYEVNGQTYWDNNDGQNYSIHAGYSEPDRFDFGVGGIAGYHADKYNDNVRGWLQVKDLGNPKEVKVIYTTNNWATSNEVNAKYYSTFSQNKYIQEWNYTFNTTADDIKYKLSYTVNGITYTDDNFGDYYTVNVH